MRDNRENQKIKVVRVMNNKWPTDKSTTQPPAKQILTDENPRSLGLIGS
jgi:hypothetical protein